MRRKNALSAIMAFACLVVTDAEAQFALWKHHGAAGTSLYGLRVRAAGDLNGDGSPDCIAVEPLLFGSSNPVVNAYSGKDGTTIHALSFPQGPNGLGLAIGAGADYTGDGVPDILLGSPGANAPPASGLPSYPFGGVYIYSGKTGQFARARLGNGVIGFGTQIWCMPDVNSDGIADYAVLVGGPAA
ncbi:MAG: VCBS repeat-containing protein, partial [Planctomycetes bacterium]|nr:VCBS repeat-containing protein [Planctomycetota bacterium]